MSNFFADDDDEDDYRNAANAIEDFSRAGTASLLDDSYSAAGKSGAADRAGSSRLGGAGYGGYGGGRQSSVTGGRAYDDSTRRGGSPSLDDILGEDLAADDGERNIEKLIRAWNNEVGAPELLRFPKRLVERIAKDLVMRKALVKQANETAGADDSLYLQASLVATENMRAAHVMKMYLRERIYKIEQFADFYLQEPDLDDRLYHSEVAHAEGYAQLMKTYLDTAALNSMPAQVTRQPLPMQSPDFSKAVFVRARRTCGPIVLPDGSTMTLEKDSQHMFRYSTIRALLERDEVELI